MALVVILVWLLALAGCGWLFVVSVRLFLRGLQRAFAPTFGPPTTPSMDGPTMPVAGAAGPDLAPPPALVTTGHAVPGWTVKMIEDHLRGCATCRAAVVDFIADQSPTPGVPVPSLAATLDALEPVTVARMVAVIERKDGRHPD